MISVPEHTIACIPFTPRFRHRVDELFESLNRHVKRDWFIKHAYFCLPLTIGNQYGFVLKSLYDFYVLWSGTDNPDSVTIRFRDEEYYNQNAALQSIKSHFGMGTITIQHGFTLRTPSGINLMTGNPPNYFIDGLTHMTGVIETDNLRRDFTFNLKITRPHHKIYVKKGDWIGYFIPYPRHFVDKFVCKDAHDIFSEEQMSEERECMTDFGKERSTEDVHKPNGNGRRYWKGEDVYGNKFVDHQKSLDRPDAV